jgi:hypothetical protein
MMVGTSMLPINLSKRFVLDLVTPCCGHLRIGRLYAGDGLHARGRLVKVVQGVNETTYRKVGGTAKGGSSSYHLMNRGMLDILMKITVGITLLQVVS